LSTSTLARLRDGEALAYDRARLSAGIVHLGIGAFHRAHQAVFTEDCIARGDLRWGILGASLRSPSVAEQLNPQDGLYSVLIRDGASVRTRIIGAGRGVLVAPQNPAALVDAMAAADTHIVSLTITEKGYKLDPATGALLGDDPEILADLADLSRPRTAIGFIVAALAKRRDQGLTPFTALSCDNLPENGERLRHAVTDFAQQIDPALAEWIVARAAFPSSMVDRIVPATLAEDLDAFEARTGLRDEGLVKTEPFSQWVIEDRFCGPRPAWEDVGVQFTDDVRPWELAKLRLLNGAHSAIAYLGALAGHMHVHEAMADPALAAYVTRLQGEAAATLHPPAGLDVLTYVSDLQSRFRNTALMHRTRQIAMDGSQKIPQRLLSSIRTRIDRGQTFEALALAVAGWMRWQSGVDERGAAYAVDDPLAADTRDAFRAGGPVEEIVSALARIEAIFGADLAADPRFLNPVTAAFTRIESLGAAGAVRATLALEAVA
jgi:fructuronate reductase